MKILLSGIDGSGKTRHVRDLRLAAKQKGIPLKTIWARRYVFSLPVLALCRFTGITHVSRNPNGFRVSDYRFYNYKPLRLVWPWTQFFDWFLFCLYLKAKEVFSSMSVIFDRFTIDAFVDIMADTRSPVGMRVLERLFLVSLAKNVQVIVLDTDEKTSMERKKDITNFQYLRRRRQIYRELALKFHWPIVSTTESYSEAQIRIIQIMIERGLFK
jgi:thymidylate kinase